LWHQRHCRILPRLCSNPPLHGALLVHQILEDPQLKQQW
jgi:aspartate/tyrosine/aromatic aminotransferase